MKFHVEAGGICNKLWDGRINFLQSAHVARSQNALIRHIQRHERSGNSGLIDNLRSMRINIRVEFCERSCVAFMSNCPAHNDDLFERLHNARLFANCQSDICQRSDRHECDLSRRCKDRFDEKIDRMLSKGLAARFWKLRIPQACVSVRLRRQEGWLHER